MTATTQPRAGASAAAPPALSVRDLRKTYDNGVEALKGISLDVEPGDFHALLGPNGAGKSTLIGIVSSLVNKTSGEVRVFGVDLHARRDEARSEEHTSELQSLMRISYAFFCLKKKNNKIHYNNN